MAHLQVAASPPVQLPPANSDPGPLSKTRWQWVQAASGPRSLFAASCSARLLHALLPGEGAGVCFGVLPRDCSQF